MPLTISVRADVNGVARLEWRCLCGDGWGQTGSDLLRALTAASSCGRGPECEWSGTARVAIRLMHSAVSANYFHPSVCRFRRLPLPIN